MNRLLPPAWILGAGAGAGIGLAPLAAGVVGGGAGGDGDPGGSGLAGVVAGGGGGGVAGAGGLAGLAGLAGASGRALDFRRSGAPPRRRRRSLLLALAKPLGVALLTVGLPLGIAVWVLTSQRFQLHAVSVQRRVDLAPAPPAPAPPVSAVRVAAGAVRQAVLERFAGRNLVRLPLDEVRLRLAANPWVAAVDVAKELPDRLRVTIAERRPVVLLRSGAELLFADAAGRPIAPVGSPAEQVAARRQGLLVVSFPSSMWAPAPAPVPPSAPTPMRASFVATAAAEAETGPGSGPGAGVVAAVAAAPGAGAGAGGAEAASRIAGALALAAQLRRLRPGWAPALSEIEVVDEEDYQLHIEGLPCPLLVRGSRLADNLVRFDQLLPELRRRYPALAGVDLRFARRIVVQPAEAAPPKRSLPQPAAAQAGAGA